LNQAPSPHKQENRELQQSVCTIWKQYRGIYGAPRIHAELQEQGTNVGHNRVAHLRHSGENDPQASPIHHSIGSNPSSGSQWAGSAVHSHPNEVWLTDITYMDTAEGFLYLADVTDLYSRQIVVMAMADHLRTGHGTHAAASATQFTALFGSWQPIHQH
jgi:putative transposase